MNRGVDFCEFNGHLVESITYEGLETTKLHVVEREIRQGAFFDCEIHQREKNELESLGIFAEVSSEVIETTSATHQNPSSPIPDPDSTRQSAGSLIDKPSRVSIRFQFKELLPWLILPAMKQSDQAGWMFGPGAAAVNLFGNDIFLQAFYRTDISPRFNTTEEFLFDVQGNYIADQPLWWNFAAVKVAAFNELKTYQEESLDINLILRYLVWRDLEVVSWSGAFIVDRDTTQGFLGTDGKSHSPWLGLGLRWDGVDNLTDPKKGVYSEVIFRQFGKKWGGSQESDFSEWLSDQQYYLSAGLNHTWIISNLVRWRQGEVPFYESFEAGGANSFRPWMPGPERSAESELLASFEYRWTWIPKTTYQFPLLDVPSYWGLQPVVGLDLVNLWSQDARGDVSALGYYGGIHVMVPALNRIRIEVANEFDRNNWVLQIGIYEKAIPQRWRLR